MKRYLIMITMVLALGLNAEAAAQKHRHHAVNPTAAAVTDSAKQDEVVAFSDTTDAVSADTSVVYDNYSRSGVVGADDWDELFSVLGDADVKDVAGILMIVAIVFFVVVLAPVLILLLIFWFIRKNRQDRLKMAEMAVKNGQPIPDELLNGAPKAQLEGNSDDELWQKGMRQTFLGIGLMFFLGYTGGNVGFGIGALVTCIGVGKLVIVKTSGMKRNPDDRSEHLF